MRTLNVLLVLLLSICTVAGASMKEIQEPVFIDRVVVHQEDNHFLGWPANNGIWMWEDGEIMVGFTRGRFAIQRGHNIAPPAIFPHESWLARSLDGGISWHVFEHEGFSGESPLVLRDISEPLKFRDKNFAMRVTGVGYHGKGVPEGGFFYSYDRGKSWKGPIAFRGLSQAEELNGMLLTGRTEYIVESNDSALVFMSVRKPQGGQRTQKAFLARTNNGGLSFDFVSWIGDDSAPTNANYYNMPTGVKTFSGKLIAAVRKRDYKHDLIETESRYNPYGWIDIYASDDNGITWKFLSRAGETGTRNGNPARIRQLSDGRLCLVYGNREEPSRIIARFSFDEGKTWGSELVLREGIETDIGYPQMVERKDGALVTIYYWATSQESEKYIEATIWDPGRNWGNILFLKNFLK